MKKVFSYSAIAIFILWALLLTTQFFWTISQLAILNTDVTVKSLLTPYQLCYDYYCTASMGIKIAIFISMYIGLYGFWLARLTMSYGCFLAYDCLRHGIKPLSIAFLALSALFGIWYGALLISSASLSLSPDVIKHGPMGWLMSVYEASVWVRLIVLNTIAVFLLILPSLRIAASDHFCHNFNQNCSVDAVTQTGPLQALIFCAFLALAMFSFIGLTQAATLPFR